LSQQIKESKPRQGQGLPAKQLVRYRMWIVPTALRDKT